MLVRIIADTMIHGKPVPAGPDPVELDDVTARLLISSYKAEKIAGPTPEQLAAATAQAKAELLEKIAAAPSVEALEELLSEDPEIVAAYEQRMQELDK